MTVSSTNQESTTSTQQGRAPQQALSHLQEEVKSDVNEAVSAVKHAAQDATGAAKKAAESQISAGKNMAVEGLGSVANALRQTANQLSASDRGLGDYVTGAATRVDQVSSYLKTRTLSDLMTDAEGYARREPALFLGGSFLLGLLGGRFLKSSAPTTVQGQSTNASAKTFPALPAYVASAPPQHTPYGKAPTYESSQTTRHDAGTTRGGVTSASSSTFDGPSKAGGGMGGGAASSMTTGSSGGHASSTSSTGAAREHTSPKKSDDTVHAGAGRSPSTGATDVKGPSAAEAKPTTGQGVNKNGGTVS